MKQENQKKHKDELIQLLKVQYAYSYKETFRSRHILLKQTSYKSLMIETDLTEITAPIDIRRSFL